MPTRAPRLCPRCLRLYRGTRCEECAKRRDVRQPATTARKTDYNGRWAAASERFLAERAARGEWWCECPECMALDDWQRDRATETDHIDGLGPSGPRGYDPTNWMPMSKRHHSRKTAAQDGGFGNRKATPELPQF